LGSPQFSVLSFIIYATERCAQYDDPEIAGFHHLLDITHELVTEQLLSLSSEDGRAQQSINICAFLWFTEQKRESVEKRGTLLWRGNRAF
jgi:hypothetical protein